MGRRGSFLVRFQRGVLERVFGTFCKRRLNAGFCRLSRILIIRVGMGSNFERFSRQGWKDYRDLGSIYRLSLMAISFFDVICDIT